MQRVWVQFLVGELRSYKCSQKKKKDWVKLAWVSILFMVGHLMSVGLWRMVLFLPDISADLLQFAWTRWSFSLWQLSTDTISIPLLPKVLPLKALWVMVTQQCITASNLKLDTSPFWMVLCLFHLWTFSYSSFGLVWQLLVMILGPSLSCSIPKFPNSC